MDSPELQNLRRFLPNLDPKNDSVTSSETMRYNCIAWASGDDTRWWEKPPTTRSPSYWPDDLDGYSPSAWVTLFQRQGYTESTQNRDLEPGLEKIAIFVKRNWKAALHVARQLPNGKWTSKLGDFEDIEHATLDVLEGEDDDYGIVGVILCRRV